jgi:hypothetical protein
VSHDILHAGVGRNKDNPARDFRNAMSKGACEADRACRRLSSRKAGRFGNPDVPAPKPGASRNRPNPLANRTAIV